MLPIPARPLIIIGAARSGTNLLRDLLCQAAGFTTWACDEINPLWRHGNARHPDDQFPPELARPEVVHYVRHAFGKVAARGGAAVIVEKTCANSLRVDFVAKILPEAQFIYIVRDGRDVVQSAMRRWCASFDWRYTMRKLRYVPAGDLAYYGATFAANRLGRLFHGQRQLAFWGPRFRGFEAAARSLPLSILCARQWRACVESAEQGLQRLGEHRVARVRYEDLVHEPRQILERLLQFAGARVSAGSIDVSHVSAEGIGKGAATLARRGDEAALHALQPTLGMLGYV